MRGALERRIGDGGVAMTHTRRDIAGRRRPHLRRALSGRLVHPGHNRQLLVFDRNRLQRILCLIDSLGDRSGDPFSDKAHNILSERGTQRRRAR